MSPRHLAPALVLLAGATLATPLHAQGARHYTLSGDVAIYNLAGQVELRAGGGNAVDVQVTPGGGDAGQLRVEQGEIRARTTLRVIYPDDRIVYRNSGEFNGETQLSVRDDGTFSDGDTDRRHKSWRDSGHRVTITSRGSGIEAHADLVITIPAGRDVAMYLAVGAVRATTVNGRLRLDTSSADVNVTGHRGMLTVDVGSGDVEVSDVEGDLSLDTGSGNVTVSRAHGTSISIDTGSGDVIGTGLSATDLKIDTGSGNIQVSGGTAETANLDTGSGDVDVEFGKGLRTVIVDTGSGDVTLRLAEGIGAELDLETSSGDIETDFPVSVTRHARDHLVGRIGDGTGRIHVETGSGGVRLVRGA